MCERFTLRLNAEAIAEHFNAEGRRLSHTPRYNIAPEDDRDVLMLTWDRDDERRALAKAQWGLIPHWISDRTVFPRLINARSETAPTKASFRGAFRERRCLLPADGFYQWLSNDRRSQPFFVHRKDDLPFAFAGLWDRWEGEGNSVTTCTILTCEANELVGEVNDRLPVILPKKHYDRWLRPDNASGDPQALLKPYPDHEERFEVYPVSRRVNNPGRESPDLVAPIDASSA